MADYAIHDTTLTGISNVIRKKDGTSALIDPADYPKRINLMGMLEEKTVSSSPIVTFADGADAVPLKKCEITLPASLDGYTEVDVVSASKNFLDDSIITKVFWWRNVCNYKIVLSSCWNLYHHAENKYYSKCKYLHARYRYRH